MQVKRTILTAGQVGSVTFPTKCGKWLVKNFSDGDIFVSFDEDFNEEAAAKIAGGCAQVVVQTEFPTVVDHKRDTIYLAGAGEVEVQQLCPEY